MVLIRPCATRDTTIHIYYLSHIYRYVGTYVSYTHIFNYAFMVNNPYLGLSAPPRCKKAKMSCTHGGLTGRRRIQSTVVASTQSVFRTDSDRQLSFEPRSACWFYFKRHSCHAESPRKEPTSNDDNFRQTFLIIDNATLKTKRQITSNILFN